jgi:hypothetical protein
MPMIRALAVLLVITPLFAACTKKAEPPPASEPAPAAATPEAVPAAESNAREFKIGELSAVALKDRRSNATSASIPHPDISVSSRDSGTACRRRVKTAPELHRKYCPWPTGWPTRRLW